MAAAQGNTFAEALPGNMILEDISKKRWRLGPRIGKGSIYSAGGESDQNDYRYAVKIKPHSNASLFAEIKLYVRCTNPVLIGAFQQKRKIETLGLPVYHGSGSYIHEAERYTFLVTDKLASNLCTLYKENNKIFPIATVFKIGIQLVDVLEYIHNCGYVHADIKPANILMGTTKGTKNKQVYLANFGMACKYSSAKKFKLNRKKAHCGTIQYLSRDSHGGVPTRRGDLEMLAYNLIQWLGCRLPWEEHLDNQVVVHSLKEVYMNSASAMIKYCFGTEKHPKAIMDYLFYLQTLEFGSDPNYKKIRKIFTSGVKEGNGSIGTSLKFSVGQSPPTKRGRVPLSVDKSGNKKLKETNKNLGEPSGHHKIPKSQTRVGEKEAKKAANDDQTSDDTDDEDGGDLMLRPERKNTANNVIKIASLKPEKHVRNPKAEEVTEDKANVRSKPQKRGIKQAANETELIPKPAKRKRKQTGNKDDEDENAKGDNDDFSVLMPKLKKRKEKQTATNDVEDKKNLTPKLLTMDQEQDNDSLKPEKHVRKPKAEEVIEDKANMMSKPQKRGVKQTASETELISKLAKRKRKQTDNEDDEDKNAKEDNDDFAVLMPKLEKRREKKTATNNDEDKNNFMPKPNEKQRQHTANKNDENIDFPPKQEKRGIIIGGDEGKEDNTVDLTPKLLRGKEILNLEMNQEPDNDSPGTKPEPTREYRLRESLSLNDLSILIREPFMGYIPAMTEIKMEKGETSQKEPGTKLDEASSSTNIDEDDTTAGMREDANSGQNFNIFERCIIM